MSPNRAYGVLAEFDSAAALKEAARTVRDQHPELTLEAYSPFPVEGLAASLGPYRNPIAPWMLLGATIGGLGTFALACYAAGWDYPLNVGGRPALSFAAFLPPAMEMTLLGAAVFGLVAMLVANGLPQVRHPLFGARGFERASADRFFLLVRTDMARVDSSYAREILLALTPLTVTEVSA